MQTFLPYKDFYESTYCLDTRRHGKQPVEADQILNVIYRVKNNESGVAWRNHPAVLMWFNYEEALKYYRNICIQTWITKGYKNNMKLLKINGKKFVYPPWIGSRKFHRSHRSNLLRKKPEFYQKYMWNVTDDLPYIWPV